jgi:hypothetical protein
VRGLVSRGGGGPVFRLLFWRSLLEAEDTGNSLHIGNFRTSKIPV